MEKFVNILPTIIMIEAFGAFIVCSYAGKWGSALYWFSATIITLSIMLIPKLG